MFLHLVAIWIFIAVGTLLAKMKTRTPQSVFDSRCRTSYHELKQRIVHCTTAYEMETLEILVHSLHEELLGKATSSLVRYICGELHAMIANRRMHLKNVLFNVN